MRYIAIAAVVLLSLMSAVVSYDHMFILAVTHDHSMVSAILSPLVVDGLILVSSIVIVSDIPSRWLPRAGLALGVGVSIYANLAFAAPTPPAIILAVVPPLALFGGVELLLRLRLPVMSVKPVTRVDRMIDTVVKGAADDDSGKQSRLEQYAALVAKHPQLTVNQLAERLGVSASTIARYRRTLKAA